MLKRGKNPQEFSAWFRENFLSVSTVCHRLVVIVRQPDMTQTLVGYVLDEEPFDFELSPPLVRLTPSAEGLFVIHS